MFLQGWIIGWMIQLVVALLLWLPLALFSGGAGSWDRAWAIGAKVRTGFWIVLLLFIGGALLVGQVQQGVPVGTNQRASTTSDGGRSAASLETASGPEIIKVYDYTTTSAPFWTPIIKATVEEFNDARPPEAPLLVYSAESGSFDCLDLPQKVADLAGIIICDTSRPGEFPHDPNAPKQGWGGFTEPIDDDLVRIVLNSYVPEDSYLPAEGVDNTVCHEMMHAYLKGVEDDYDSDANSCVWGNMLAPGPTDNRLMREKWLERVAEPTRSVPVEEPSRPEQARDAVPDVDVDVPDPVPPTIEPTPTPHRPIATAVPTTSARSGCDPAYPEQRTCIPPGPPLEFPCAITEERNFTVLPPDPRGLDRDRDGVGCEPIGSS